MISAVSRATLAAWWIALVADVAACRVYMSVAEPGRDVIGEHALHGFVHKLDG